MTHTTRKQVPPQTHSILVLLVQQGLLTTDELRRGVEALPGHAQMSYYHRFAVVLISAKTMVAFNPGGRPL